MQVSVEQVGGLERRLRVEVPEQQIATRVKTRLQEVARSARVDGFRPGRAPARVIERLYGSKLRGEVVSDVVRSSFAEAVGEQQLRPVADPVIDPIEAAPGSGVSYTATFEVYPEVVLAPLEQLAVERPQCEVTGGDVDKMVEVLRGQNKTWEDVTRPAAAGDQLILDFQGKLDGEAFEGGSATDFKLELGTQRMIPGFEDGLVGASAGDTRTLQLQFPADYHKQELAGRPVTFDVNVKRVCAPVLPELDAEFFQKFGVQDGGLDAFRQEVRENMERERDRALERRFNSTVLDRVRDANDFELPKTLVKVEAARMQREMLRNLAMRGVDPAQLKPEDLPGFEPQAEKRVKLGLIMAEIIRQAGIVAEPAKVRARVEALAASYEQPDAFVKWYYEDPRRLQEIESMCLEEEAVKWIAERARINDVTVSFDDLMNPGQTAANT
jgi:trigger factor